jgi:glycosyltransferase involved in cell wall biosynthesis
LKGWVLCWHGGIDSRNWQPSTETKDRDNVLIYWKTEPEEFCENVVELVRGLRTNPAVIRYGKYNVREYKEQLDKSRFAIFISRSESQGIALAEAWSMNVPTLVFDPGNLFFTGRTIYNVSACPYLTNETGLAWKNLDELKRMITDKNLLKAFAPREYVLRQFTDEYSAKQLIRVLNK